MQRVGGVRASVGGCGQAGGSAGEPSPPSPPSGAPRSRAGLPVPFPPSGLNNLRKIEIHLLQVCSAGPHLEPRSTQERTPPLPPPAHVLVSRLTAMKESTRVSLGIRLDPPPSGPCRATTGFGRLLEECRGTSGKRFRGF